jgi:hypothetical protein
MVSLGNYMVEMGGVWCRKSMLCDEVLRSRVLWVGGELPAGTSQSFIALVALFY